MVFSIDTSHTISIELIQDAHLINFVTDGAELEFLPLTDFPIYRLAPKVIKKLKQIYDLSKINGGIITRQPHFNRLIQMIVTDKQAMLKTAYKYDNLQQKLQYDNQQLKLSNYFQNLKITWDYIKLKQRKNPIDLQSYNTNQNQIEQTVLAIFNRLEALGLVEAPGDNVQLQN